jgi:ribosome-associated protein
MTIEEKLKIAVKALDNKKAEDLKALKIADLTVLTEYFIIAHGNSTTHARSLADEVEFRLSEKGTKPKHVEGHNGSEWVVLDYGDFIIHVFCKTAREFYKLERLWADGQPLSVVDGDLVDFA